MKNEKLHMPTEDGGRPRESVSSSYHSRQSVGTNAGRDRAADIVVGDAEIDIEVSPEALNRALALLSRWALRCGQKVPGNTGADSENLVTDHGIKGYGGMNGSN